MPASEATPTPLPTIQVTSTASQTVTSQGSPLSFKLSVAPEQASPGDEVTYTIEISNNSQAPLTGLPLFECPSQGIRKWTNGFKDFSFDPQTRLLTWNGAKTGTPTLAPGQKLNLTYTTRVDAQLDEAQIINSATLSEEGLSAPLVAEAVLTVIAPQKRLTMLDAQGGKALGLNEHVQVSLPKDLLNTPYGLLVQDLREQTPADGSTPADPTWLKFALELRVPKPGDAQSLSKGSTETDRIIPMEPIEAQFDQPVEIAVSFNGLADLSTLEADKTPFLVTLDDASGTWVRVPLKSIDRESNQITAEVTHFSTWGVGIGSSFPTNSANILLFDNAYSDLFTGRAHYSLPLWVPPGRNGMAPSLTLSYSSGVADGVLGDVQGSWVGLGWSIDSVEIARKITNGVCGTGCGSGSYGYENKFLLLFNGTGYELIPDGTTAERTTPKAKVFCISSGIAITWETTPRQRRTPPVNGGKWCKQTAPAGGWGRPAAPEQLAPMKGYPGAATGAWSALGYAGSATDVIALRWRVDQVTDTFGNQMTYTYFEENRPVAGTATDYNRASYLDTIAYTGTYIGNPSPGYSVVFARVNPRDQRCPCYHD